ncbi:Glucose dehydrogenase -like protein [Halotydeus destructor]|nr:Glucose dehydrogenase -like protein [Halotydeus destructor]
MNSSQFLTLLVALGEDLWNSSGQVRSIQSPLDSYDYVIVGAGAAGAVLASRLTEDPAKMVLLIDKGGASNRASDIPYIYRQWESSPLVQQHETIKQEHACGSGGGKCSLLSGTLLGGGTAVNGMAFVRGNRLDYDSYAAKGLPTWSYDKVLPFFKKFENSVNYKSEYRGDKGPVNITTDQWSYLDNLTKRWISAGQEVFGVGPTDYNGKTQKTFSKLQRLAYRGIRQSSDRCYLQPLDQKRENLHILTFAHVTKVLFKGTKAIGVEYISVRNYDNNTRHTVKVKKEVILSAGTLGTPALLMLSGIGPKAHLQGLAIEIIADRPGVGQNLQDPSWVPVNLKTNETYPKDGHPSESNYRQWLTKGTTVLKSTNSVGLALLPSIRSTNYSDDVRTEYTFDTVEPRDNDTSLGMTIVYYLLQPTSRGYVKLRSSDPLDDPIVDPKYLSGEGDLKEAISAIKGVIRLTKAKAFQDLALAAIAPELSGCDYEAWSDDYITCYLKEYADTSIHASGTCKMGNSSDPMAVVDDQLRVYGVQNLRVVDNSIWPTVPRAHTTAPCMMAGEVAATLIGGPSL